MEASASVLMTRPRVLRLLLMLAASRRRVPLAPLFFACSEPARSTRDSLAVRSVAFPAAASIVVCASQGCEAVAYK